MATSNVQPGDLLLLVPAIGSVLTAPMRTDFRPEQLGAHLSATALSEGDVRRLQVGLQRSWSMCMCYAGGTMRVATSNDTKLLMRVAACFMH